MSGASPVRKGQVLPVVEAASSQASIANRTGAITLPAGFARQAKSSRPRAHQANAVVIPHAGHGLPVISRNAHPPNPSWVCVPNPRGSGRRMRAVTSTPTSPRANIANVARVFRPSRETWRIAGYRPEFVLIRGGFRDHSTWGSDPVGRCGDNLIARRESGKGKTAGLGEQVSEQGEPLDIGVLAFPVAGPPV